MFFFTVVSVLQEITRNLIPQSSSNEVYKWKKLYVYFSKTELLFEVDFNDDWLSDHNAHKKMMFDNIDAYVDMIVHANNWIFRGKNDIQIKRKWSKKRWTLSKRCKTFFLCKWNFFQTFHYIMTMRLKEFEAPFFEYWRFSQNKEQNRIYSANSTLNSIYHHRIINKKTIPKRKNCERCRLFLPRLLAISE